jgi:transposase InsO family protein
LLQRIQHIFFEHKGRYGCLRITSQLRDEDIVCGHNRVARLMREHGLRAKAGRRYRGTTNSRHSFPIAKNIVNRAFTVGQPDKVWVSDITQIGTSEGWLYLALVMDLFSRRIVGWSVDRLLTASLAVTALEQAIACRNPENGLIIHTDQGCQYASHSFQQLLLKHGFISSMSRKGDCYDNACMESFIHTLKVELVHTRLYQTRNELKDSLFEYIELYYNKKRKHSTLEYKSPIEYERVKKVA